MQPLKSLLMYCLLFWQTEFSSVNMKELSNFDIFEDNLDKFNKTFSIFLSKGRMRSFWKLKPTKEKDLTFIVVPCSANITWAVSRYTFTESNQKHDALTQNMKDEGQIETIHSEEVDTMSYFQVTRQGFYVLSLTASADTFVQIHSSNSPTALPVPLSVPGSKFTGNHKIFLQSQVKRTIAIRWNPSLLNPKMTTYCLVINPHKHYQSLCAARKDRDGFSAGNCAFTDQIELSDEMMTCPEPNWTSSQKLSMIKTKFREDITIKCVGDKTSTIIKDFLSGSTHFFNVFAMSTLTNVSVLHASKKFKYIEPNRSIKLRDGKPVSKNLNKLGGSAVFKFKVNRNGSRNLEFVILPCGGSVQIELSLAGHKTNVIERGVVTSMRRLFVPGVQLKQRYKLKVFDFQNLENHQRSSNVEVMATMNKTVSALVPVLPNPATVHEYEGLRSCRSITVGWMPVRKPQFPVWYCVYAFEKDSKSEFNPVPNQCKLDANLKSHHETLASVQCHQIKTQEDSKSPPVAIVRNVSFLKPNVSYIIQVVAKLQKNRSFSYDRLAAMTKISCKRFH